MDASQKDKMPSNSSSVTLQLQEGKHDPAERIEPYNWDQLTDQFYEDLTKHHDEEAALFQKLEQLTNYFGVWAATVHHTDSERATKRLKTRIAKVQMSEDSLEQKRQHYLDVVQAFQTALRLLNDA